MSLRSGTRLRWAAALLALGLALALNAGSALSSVWQPGGGQQADLASLGAAAERNGDYAAAEADYRLLAASSDPGQAATGSLDLGRVLERHGSAADGVAPLQAAIAALGSTPDGSRATFLLGEAQLDLKQNDAAAASFQAYIAAGGPAAGEAALERAAAFQAAGAYQQALDALAAPLQASSSVIRAAALQASAAAHEQFQDYPDAAADEQALAALTTGSMRAAALGEAARLLHLAGNDLDAIATWQQIIAAYPSSAAAGTAIDRLQALGASTDSLLLGIAQFEQDRARDAAATLRGLLASSPSADAAAQATYFIARIEDRADQNDAALSDYAAAFALAPNGVDAAAALWHRAVLLSELKRYAEAQQAFSSFLQQFPRDGDASEAAFQVGWMAYLDGRSLDAAAAWAGLAQSSDAENAARAELWLGKLAQGQDDTAGAAAHFARAEALQPGDYYGLRAEALASGAAVAISGDQVQPPSADWGAVESWLARWAGAEPAGQFAALQSAQNWREGIELDALGWMVTPNALLSDALLAVAQQPWTLYRAARALADRGRTNLALQAAQELLHLAGARLDAPAALLRLAYPVDYVDLVNQDAARYGLDPLLIEAVVRQESGFNPVAGSSAGAQGLLQLEPATAQDVADAVGLTTYSASDLTRPLVNLQLGSAFLAQQAKAGGQDLTWMLAAYNGGGGNATRWSKQSGSDPDRFYETVNLSETRLYIRLVTENYAMYLFLYRGATHPTLLRL
jgi:soluble lytic murein transglycosylase